MISNSRENTTSSPVFLRIRLAALDKAVTEVRHRRMDLERSMDNGSISQEDYQRQVVKLIVEGTSIKSEQKVIESRLGI